MFPRSTCAPPVGKVVICLKGRFYRLSPVFSLKEETCLHSDLLRCLKTRGFGSHFETVCSPFVLTKSKKKEALLLSNADNHSGVSAMLEEKNGLDFTQKKENYLCSIYVSLVTSEVMNNK